MPQRFDAINELGLQQWNIRAENPWMTTIKWNSVCFLSCTPPASVQRNWFHTNQTNKLSCMHSHPDLYRERETLLQLIPSNKPCNRIRCTLIDFPLLNCCFMFNVVEFSSFRAFKPRAIIMLTKIQRLITIQLQATYLWNRCIDSVWTYHLLFFSTEIHCGLLCI